ncbi:MAG: hypothetical protein MUW56_14475 [Chryseobacterium sp.]|uniref:hypothetical protein n=1 Tax=Chryseobacterium sp. TaxID=1871047 RepID=UPI0025C69CDA|nr:hypothetical protein [Chryseobacterium sp.]MCJ7934792.1 hypothetical protein [Chryseobacterium sp.]
MQKDIRKEFLPLVSRPWWGITWLARIFGSLLLLGMFLFLLVFPVLICKRWEVLAVVSILYYPVLAIGLYRFVRHLKKTMNRAVKRIIVDDKGIHYEREDGSVDEILYIYLEKWSFDEYDVSISPRNKIYALKVNDRGAVTEVDFNGVDAGFTYYIGNLKALRIKFIQGITCFRPDLRIDPLIYEVYHINPVHGRFDRRKYWMTTLKMIAFMLLITSVSGFLLYKLGKMIF